MKTILEVDHLKKYYRGKKAVDDIGFQVSEGEVFGLLGPNGAGKSTTIECILGIKKATEGHVSLLGFSNPSPRSKGYTGLIKNIGVQFQRSFFPDRIRVGEMCEMISALYNDPLCYESYLKLFGLHDKMNQDVSKLSGGEQQKLSLILAILHKPKLVFLDELTTGLDPEARRDVWAVLKTLQRQGLTIVLTSHYMDEVTNLCDKVMVIKEGQMIFSGSIQDALKWTGKDNMEDAYLSIVGEEAKRETLMDII